MMRIALCDDNRILCEALGAVLEAHGHQVVSITTNTADGIAAVAAHQPDACLMDVSFPGQDDGLTAARVILERHPGTLVLILSGFSDPVIATAALSSGVAGYVRKDRNADQIAEALDVIGGGGAVFDAALTSQARPQHAASRRAGPLCALTPREQEVLRRIVDGQSTGQMAREMGIATSTLRTYVKSVLYKVGAHSRLQAAALASQDGLLGERSA